MGTSERHFMMLVRRDSPGEQVVATHIIIWYCKALREHECVHVSSFSEKAESQSYKRRAR
jgi:hypothetical protein